MDNEQIFKKAVEKAVINGWEGWRSFMPLDLPVGKKPKDIFNDIAFSLKEKIIFDKKFAEAFYPKGWTCFKLGEWVDCEEDQKLKSNIPFVYPKYIFHLMESVKQDEPLRYLEKFIK